MNREQYLKLRALEDRHWWYVGTRAIARDVLEGLSIRPDSSVLDAGCGTGGNLAMLSRFGRVVGVDISELALSLASPLPLGASSRPRGQGRVKASPTVVPGLAAASISALPFADAAFDLVTSFEVLYHRAVVDDLAALRELRRVLRPHGFLLLRLPAFEWLRGAHDEAVHTARRYTAGELRGKLRHAGLEPLRVSYLNAFLLPLAAAKRFAERATAASGDDLGSVPALVEALFRVALAAERRLLRRIDLPIGVSVMALARRPLDS